MKRFLMSILAVVFVAGMSQMVFAGGEHGGKEHGGSAKGSDYKGSGKEHGGGAVATKAPTKDEIRNAMKSYVMAASAATGTFDVKDPDTGKMLNLQLKRVHQRVGKTGDYYYSCADFTETNTGAMYDLDLDVADHGGHLSVADVRVHKKDGKARYTYDDDDNRVPLIEGTKSHKGSAKGSDHKGSGKEHGGHEHGGKEHGGN